MCQLLVGPHQPVDPPQSLQIGTISLLHSNFFDIFLYHLVQEPRLVILVLRLSSGTSSFSSSLGLPYKILYFFYHVFVQWQYCERDRRVSGQVEWQQRQHREQQQQLQFPRRALFVWGFWSSFRGLLRRDEVEGSFQFQSQLIQEG